MTALGRRFFLFCLLLAFFLAGATPGLAKRPPREIIASDGAPMVLVPEGDFNMGSRSKSQNLPVHEVETDGFYIDKYEVTNELFARFLNAMRALGKDSEREHWIVIRTDLLDESKQNWWPTEIVFEEGEYKPFPGFERHPVNSVNWYGANAYCQWAGKRLPTEAEWEKAARGGLKGKLYPWGSEIPTGGIIFNRRWTDNRGPVPTEPVGNYHPNAYGIFDMAGNVWEWCSDWFDPDYYRKSPRNNPAGPGRGQTKVLRGGSWYNSALYLRVDFRNSADPRSTDDAVGFRCVTDLKK